MSQYIVSLVLVGITVLAFVLGNYVRTRLRMPDAGWKVTLIVAVLGIAGVILQTSWPPKQGIDLKGGVILIYKVDEALTRQNARRQTTDEDGANLDDDAKVNMPALIEALGRRINPGGVEEIVVRRYGDTQVEIIIPEAKTQEVERVKKLITTGGFLKFMIVANQTDHGHIWRLADDPRQAGQYEVRDETGKVVGQWVKLSIDPRESRPDQPVYREDPPSGKNRVVRGRKEILMVVDQRYNLQGSHLASVRKGYKDVNPCVYFDMTATGARLMFRLTSENEPNPTANHYSLLGIVMDGELISAPRINETISGSGIIEGSFTDAEVDLLVNVLRAGRLPAVLYPEPISQNQISPLLGQDTIDQGRRAILISLAAVLVFMVIYYHFAGIVACLALLTNLVLILALMIFVGASFSLPGMAGLVLTVGMSVDANVLIFERIREELRNGAALRMAIRNGFGRATRTIVDANVTTLITAVVLYGIGTEQLRAFAVTLIFGILMCLFTAIFCSRVVFDMAERRGWIKKLTMLQIVSSPNWNLIGKRHLAGVASVALIVVSLVAVSARGTQIFDIDFLGGTSVQMLLKEPMPVAEVRAFAESLKEEGTVENISVTEVKSSEKDAGMIYRVDTSIPSGNNEGSTSADGEEGTPPGESAVQTIQNALAAKFAGRLQMHSLNFSDPVEISSEPSTPATNNSPLDTPPLDTPPLDTPPTDTPQNDASQSTGDNDADTQAEVNADDLDGDAGLPSAADEDGESSTTSDAAAPDVDEGSSVVPSQEMLLASLGDTWLAQADDALPRSDDANSSASPLSDTTSDETSEATPSESETSFPETTIPTPTPNALDLISDASTLRTQSTLEFDEGINAETLEELIRETARDLDLTEPDVVLENPEWDNADTRSFSNWTLKISSDIEQTRQILNELKNKLDNTPVWLAANQIGSTVAGDKTRMALAAVIASLLGIVGYIWIRFQRVVYGLAAVVALVHDVTITLGAIALSTWLATALGFLMIDEFKISLPVVAAFLTIIGYSLNDTIVVFDRVREVKGKSPDLTVDMVNASINQTLSRTFLTSLTTLIAVGILYVIGGQGIHAFAYALLVGVIVGTYSSIFVASPMLLWMSGSTKREKVGQKVAA